MKSIAGLFYYSHWLCIYTHIGRKKYPHMGNCLQFEITAIKPVVFQLRYVSKEWGGDPLGPKQWEEALQSVQMSPLSMSQRLSLLYIIFHVHYNPSKLSTIGIQVESICTRCRQDHENLIHMLWRCSKLCRYWERVINVINQPFDTGVKLDPKQCL